MSEGVSPAHVRLEDGSIIEQDVLGIIEKVMEYDPNLRVQYLDPDRFPEMTDAPFRIIERCPDGLDRVVFSVWTLNEEVMHRLYAADNKKTDVIWQMDRTNQAARASKERRFAEEREESKDIIEHVLKSPKGKYTFKNEQDEIVTIDDSL